MVTRVAAAASPHPHPSLTPSRMPVCVLCFYLIVNIVRCGAQDDDDFAEERMEEEEEVFFDAEAAEIHAAELEAEAAAASAGAGAGAGRPLKRVRVYEDGEGPAGAGSGEGGEGDLADLGAGTWLRPALPDLNRVETSIAFQWLSIDICGGEPLKANPAPGRGIAGSRNGE